MEQEIDYRENKVLVIYPKLLACENKVKWMKNGLTVFFYSHRLNVDILKKIHGFVKHYAPIGNKVKKNPIFSTEVKIKVTRSLNLVLFERA